VAHEREVVLIRHGETEWSVAGKHTGRTDVPLTERGRLQAQRLAQPLERWQLSLTLTSPLRRASETCELAGLTGEVDDDLAEWDYGALEGRTTLEIRQDLPGWTVWDGTVEGGEHIDHVAARARRVIARIEQTDGDVALASHGHFLRVLAACWLDLSPCEGRRFMLDPATISVLSTERGVRAVRSWNAAP
jgi:broad specificity phosphatase PhoE